MISRHRIDSGNVIGLNNTIMTDMNILIRGGSFADERGTVQFVNGYKFKEIKRFYTLFHPDISVIRAWQGHKIESKSFFVTNGQFLICWVEIDNWNYPSKYLEINRQILDADTPQILVIRGGNATGIKALEPNSRLVVFSDLTLEDAKDDDYRFEPDYWRM